MFLCLKPVAEEVERHPMCKFHAAMRKRMRADEQKRRDVDRAQAERVRGWNERAQKAARRLGVKASLDMFGLEYVERVCVSLEDFEKLAAKK